MEQVIYYHSKWKAIGLVTCAGIILTMFLGFALYTESGWNFGVCFDDSDISAIVTEIKSLLGDSSRMKKYGSNGLKAIERYYNREMLMKKFEHEISKTMANK